MSDPYFNFYIFIHFLGQNQMNGCDCWGPDCRLDTLIDQIDLRHIYDIYDIYGLSGPQLSQLYIRFGPTNLINLKKDEISVDIFSLYKFWKSCIFVHIWSQLLRIKMPSDQNSCLVKCSWNWILLPNKCEPELQVQIFIFSRISPSPNTYGQVLLLNNKLLGSDHVNEIWEKQENWLPLYLTL
jgi:hypothetical protein